MHKHIHMVSNDLLDTDISSNQRTTEWSYEKSPNDAHPWTNINIHNNANSEQERISLWEK